MNNEPEEMTKGEAICGALWLIAAASVLAYLFWVANWPILFGAAVTIGIIVFAIGLVIAVFPCVPAEEIEIYELQQRERHARQCAAAIEAETNAKSALLTKQFLDKLSPEDRALLALRLHADARVAHKVEDLERALAAARPTRIR